MFRRRIVIVISLAALCAGLAIGVELIRPPPYLQSEYRLRDLIARSGRTTPRNPDLLFFAIDSASVSLDPELDVDGLLASSAHDPASRGALQLMTKSWPWDREVYALILERLVGAGAKVVAFDCLFPAPGPGDDAFRAALDRFKAKVVIGSNFVSPRDVDRALRIPSSYEPPAETLIPKTALPDDRVGFTNFFTGENKTVRGAQYRVGFREHGSITAAYLSISARVLSKAGHPELVPHDLAEHPFRFTGPPRHGFRPHSVFEIFVPEYWKHNYQAGELLRDKIVIIGGEGNWQKDELATPFGFMPGAELHLNSLNALLHREFLSELTPIGNAGVILMAALVAVAICISVRSPWLRLLALLVADGASPFGALWFYNHPGVYLPCLGPLFALNATVLISFVADFALERIEKARLRSTLSSRDDLTNMIVHDLRSPLTIVTGYIDALTRMASGKLTPTEAKYIAQAQRGADNLRDMITTLLDVSRLEAGQMPLHLEPHDINAIAREATARFAPLLQGRTFHCHGTSEPLIVSCDAGVIGRVLENLMSNALKFTKAHGTISIEVERTGGGANIAVRDDGAGIPFDQHEHIFEKFGQTDTGAKKKNSTGLGLAFCRMAVEAHGGRIGVQSEPGNGSTFHFTLPIQSAARIEGLAASKSR
ncbi:MAG TPA: CHASE2 domain-containing protein [Chthoniobacterales bacterium]|nr:CHASE2 domain-containing protein [Chthoniobacterales bacterium]